MNQATVYKCLECGYSKISNYDGEKCEKCGGHMSPMRTATKEDMWNLPIVTRTKKVRDSDEMTIFIGDKRMSATGKVIVTYTSNREFTYDPKEVSRLYLNENTIIDIRVLRNVD